MINCQPLSPGSVLIVHPRRQAERAELQRLVGRDGRRFVGARPPRRARRHELGFTPSLHRRPAVLDRDVRPVNRPLRLDVRAPALPGCTGVVFCALALMPNAAIAAAVTSPRTVLPLCRMLLPPDER